MKIQQALITIRFKFIFSFRWVGLIIAATFGAGCHVFKQVRIRDVAHSLHARRRFRIACLNITTIRSLPAIHEWSGRFRHQ
jgi:hypothetical protein